MDIIFLGKAVIVTATVADRLRKARMRKGLKQIDVYRKTGIHNKTLSGYENSVSEPDIETLKILAELYEVSLDYISGNDHPKDSTSPDFATSKDKRDLKNFLEQDETIWFDGIPLDDDAKRSVRDVLTGLFWEAKQMNKRKKKTDDSKDNDTNE